MAKYSGWTNYETWAVALWADNDQGSEEAMIELAADTPDKFVLAEAFKAWHADSNPIADDVGVYTDLLGAALDRVDWLEIAEHYITKAKELV